METKSHQGSCKLPGILQLPCRTCGFFDCTVKCFVVDLQQYRHRRVYNEARAFFAAQPLAYAVFFAHNGKKSGWYTRFRNATCSLQYFYHQQVKGSHFDSLSLLICSVQCAFFMSFHLDVDKPLSCLQSLPLMLEI